MDMEARFLPAATALRRGDLQGLQRGLADDPSLAAGRSRSSHPTLLQCLVLDGFGLPAETQRSLADALIEAGAPLDEPLIACGSGGNTVLAEHLLDRGARLEGDSELLRGWTVLEEAIYWGQPELIELLLARGAGVKNLRVAAGLGRVADIRRFFDSQGRLALPEAGTINWPFGLLPEEQCSDDAQDILDHALTYAALSENLDAVRTMLDRGARITSFPLGFHYRGTALHWAAVRGDRLMCELLIALGADPSARDLTVELTPAGWARHGKHAELVAFLESSAHSVRG